MSHVLQGWLYGVATFLAVVLVLFLAAWIEQWWRWRKGNGR